MLMLSQTGKPTPSYQQHHLCRHNQRKDLTYEHHRGFDLVLFQHNFANLLLKEHPGKLVIRLHLSVRQLINRCSADEMVRTGKEKMHRFRVLLVAQIYCFHLIA